MVNLIRIPSFAYCSLHSGPILPASWAVSEADCKVCYAALRAAALEKSATTTLSVAFNLVCSLINGNSARTRNPNLPITASKPVHPHGIWNSIRRLRSKNLLVLLSQHDTVLHPHGIWNSIRRLRSKNLLVLLSQHDTVFLDSASRTYVRSACPLPSPDRRQNRYIPG